MSGLVPVRVGGIDGQSLTGLSKKLHLCGGFLNESEGEDGGTASVVPDGFSSGLY